MHIYQNKNELIWVTTSEVNNSYFSVEGSGDGVHWVALSTTDSKSTNSNEINEYSTIINARNIVRSESNKWILTVNQVFQK